MTDRHLAIFEVKFTADDKIDRTGLNGKPMYSKEAMIALHKGVDAFRAEMERQGYKGSMSYGIRVEPYDGEA